MQLSKIAVRNDQFYQLHRTARLQNAGNTAAMLLQALPWPQDPKRKTMTNAQCTRAYLASRVLLYSSKHQIRIKGAAQRAMSSIFLVAAVWLGHFNKKLIDQWMQWVFPQFPQKKQTQRHSATAEALWKGVLRPKYFTICPPLLSISRKNQATLMHQTWVQRAD
jgi:hypothetical protein